MKNSEKKNNKKSKRLIVETGIFISVILSVLFLTLAIIIITITIFLEKTSINDNLYVNVLEIQSEFKDQIPSFMLDYLIDNPEVMSNENLELFSNFENIESLDMEDIPERLNETNFNALSEESKNYITILYYKLSYYRMNYIVTRNRRDYISILDVSDPQNPFVVMYADNSDISEIFVFNKFLNNSSFRKNSPDINISEHPAIEAIINGSSNPYEIEKINPDNSPSTIIAAPLFVGNSRYIAILSDETEDVSIKEILKILFPPLVLILIGVICIAIIISVYIYIIITRPLSKITDSIRGYINDKNSETVEYQMSEIKSKNEIGELADEFCDLTSEIDRYNNEHINLIKETGKYESDLNVAASIQNDMLIKDFPDDSRFRLFASMTPAKEVGGDFYDFFMIDDDHLCMTIADVSGKGVPASLVMMATLTSIRDYASLINSPEKILERVNEEICRKNMKDMFVTVWLGILDLKTGTLITSNAGHEYPAININGSFELFKDKHGFVIGGMSGTKYKTEEIHLKAGDTIFVYTDGVPEATNAKDEMFGTDRMLEVLNNSPDAQPEELLKNVKASVDEFAGEAPQFDDLTVLSIKLL